MAKLYKDVAILLTQICENYVAKDLVDFIDNQISSPIKLIIFSSHKVIISSLPEAIVSSSSPASLALIAYGQ